MVKSNHFGSNVLIKGAMFVLILAMVLASLTIALHSFVTSHATFGADFYVFWLAGREVFKSRGNPYSETVSNQAQLGIYGRPAVPGENSMMFVNPVYSLLLIYPTIWMTYPMALAFWIAFNVIFLVLSALVAIPRLPLWAVATIPFAYPVARGIVIGQFSPSLGGILLLVYAIVFGKRFVSPSGYFAAGALLAWTTIKPQLCWLLTLFFLLHAYRTRRWQVFWGLGVGLLGLAFVGWLLMPGWPSAWLQQAALHADDRLVQPGILLWVSWISPVQWLRWVGLILMGLAIFAAIHILYRWWQGGLSSTVVFASVALLTLIVHPLYLPPAQIILLLPLLAWVGAKARWDLRERVFIWLAALVLPWVIFLLSFEGAEPYEMSYLVPVLFTLWIFWLARRCGRQRLLAFQGNTP